MTPPRTIRLRLTLLYLGLFVLSAACLLVITYLLVDHQVVVTSSGSSGTCPAIGASTPPPPSDVATCISTLRRQAAVTERGAALDQLLLWSGVALAIMAVASVGLGWLMAGRVLRPLRVITGAARRISASSLDQRLALTGPDDELKELGDTFDALLGRLDASFRAQRQFVANASHELRTPLARQRTILEVALRRRDAAADDLRAACSRALAAGEEATRLIDALLTLATSERGIDAFEPLDLAAVAADVLAERAVPVRLIPELDLAPGSGSPALTRRLVANLVDNAIRYNIPDGRVEVITGTRDGQAFLVVANTGPVVPADALPRLFQPFQRLDGRTRSGEGFGLGLAIVAAIAAAHGATVHAAALADGGLRVQLVFPRVGAAGAGSLSM